MFCGEIIKTIIDMDVYQMPVVKPCSFQVLFPQRKAKWPNQMEIATCCSTKAGDIACILGYFGLEKSYIEQLHYPPCAL